MNVEEFKETLKEQENKELNTVIVHPKLQKKNPLVRWIEDAWWSWGNCVSFRFDKYEDNIDRCAFFEEINCGWYQEYIYPYDDWYNPTISKERQLRLG
jgi:hypothetical protein